MEPISTVASIIAIYQLASTVKNFCFRYAGSVQNANKETDYVIDEIVNFQRSLRTLKGMLEDEENVNCGGDRLKNLRELIHGDSVSLKHCRTDLEDLQVKLERKNPKEGDGKFKQGMKVMTHKILWPLKEEEVKKVTDRLKKVAVMIDRVVIMDSSEIVRNVDITTKWMASSLENAEVQKKEEEMRENIFQWLRHPDKAENHNLACRARNDRAKTCRWFLDGDAFKEFRKTPQSLLFLHGDSGCGKTVLCSAIIEELQALRAEDTQIEVAFWYYNTNEKERTSLNNLVRALITQFMPFFSPVPTALVDLWKAKKMGKETPKVSDLIQTLQKILTEKANRTCYIVLDALDESDEYEREELMEMIRSFLSLDNDGIRILLTSRTNTTGIENELKELTKFYNIAIERNDVDTDILAHVTERLQNDKTLKAWPEKERQMVKSVLMEKAAGMFRWVHCQIQAIRKCKTPADLNKTLHTLPRDVHEQYARELAAITDNPQRALKILQWLTFSRRKLRIEEVTDMIAVDLDQDPPVFDDQNKMWNSEGVIEICGSLVRADVNRYGRNSLGEPAEVQTLTTAHATVSDFLKSRPIRIGTEPDVWFTRSTVNLRMAETCLVYLRFFVDNNIEFTEKNLLQYPFARYCAKFWDAHYREAIANHQEKVDMTRLNDMIMALFKSSTAMLQWIRLSDPHNTYLVYSKKIPLQVYTPIYYAAMLGLPEIARRLIDQGAEIDDIFDGGYGTALVAASALGEQEIVSLLLEKGADPNLSGYWYWGCPLAVALEENQTKIAKMLLERENIDINCRRNPLISKDKVSNTVESHLGANVDSVEDEMVDDVGDETEITQNNAMEEEGIEHKKIEKRDQEILNEDYTLEEFKSISSQSMVYIAISSSSSELLKILLQNGADPNIEGGQYKTALQYACACGYDDEAMTLLNHGAKVDIYGGSYESSLIAACYKGSTEIVRRLIANGSDVNHAGGKYVCALYAACLYNNEDIVEMLLEQKPKMDIYGDKYDNPLQVACASGKIAIAKRLIEAGSDLNRKGGFYGTALYAACIVEKKDLVELLLDNGADPNTQECGDRDNPLQTACEAGNEAIVRLLLEKKANSNLHGGIYGGALQAACFSGKSTIVQLLLENGADIKFRGGFYETPLQAAVKSGIEAVVQLVLDCGESVNEKGGNYSYPVVRASAGKPSSDPVLRLLLENGADPNLENEKDDELARLYRTPLQYAANESTATMLLEYGARINTHSGDFGTALHCAIGTNWKQPGMTKLLISHGADVNAPHWDSGTPLALACNYGKLDEVKLLLKNGAKLDVCDMIGVHPICVAIIEREWDVFTHLIELGGNPTYQDKRGCSGLHYVARAGGNNALKRILDLETDNNAVDSNGWSPLHWAAASAFGTAKVLKTLLQAGCAKDLKDKQGRTALDLATAFGKDEEIAILTATGHTFLDLPETNDGDLQRSESKVLCDGCGDERENREPECYYHCMSCMDFDFCFRCILDKDVIHFPDHEFTVKRRQISSL